MESYYSFINGQFLTKGCRSKKIINPSTLDVVGKYYPSSRSNVVSAVSAARNALALWKDMSIDERAEIIYKAAELLIEHQGNMGDLIMTDIMQRITHEMGKSIHEAEIEIFESSDCLRYFAEEGSKILSEESVEIDSKTWPDKNCIIDYQPVGIIGIIKPWNYPLEIPIWSIGAALIAGNTIVYKPSELTPGVGCYIAELFAAAGLPDGVLNVILGDGEIGNALVEADVDMISFTGSSSVGEKIQYKCAQKGIPCVLELGGKDAAIICNDANLTRAVNGSIWGGLCNCGQVCVSSERYFVQEQVYDTFIAQAVDLVSSLKIGNGCDKDADVTCLVSSAQLRIVEDQIHDAVRKGAKIMCGGKKISRTSTGETGYYFEPTIIVNVDEGMRIVTEETFGPIIAIQKFTDDNEVVDKVNSTPYGLGASIWTTDIERAKTISRKLDVGMIWINDVNICIPQCPWGGIKGSGHGRDLSKFGILEYVRIKSIMYDFSSSESQPWWYPYSNNT